jgi:hypothetical protein
MANVGSKGIMKFSDDFAIADMATSAASGVAWVTLDDADSAGDFVRAVSAAKGLHATSILDATDNHLSEFCSDTLLFTAELGYCMVECTLMFNTVTTVAFNFGFSDDVLDDSNTLPIELADTTFTNNCSDGCALMVYDTDATNDEIHCIWANGGTIQTSTSTDSVDGDTLRMKGAVPIANKWMYMRVELQDRGSGNGARATFHWECTGKTFEKTFNTTVDRDLPLCFYLGFENRDAVTHTAYLKLPGWEQTIAD